MPLAWSHAFSATSLGGSVRRDHRRRGDHDDGPARIGGIRGERDERLRRHADRATAPRHPARDGRAGRWIGIGQRHRRRALAGAGHRGRRRAQPHGHRPRRYRLLDRVAPHQRSPRGVEPERRRVAIDGPRRDPEPRDRPGRCRRCGRRVQQCRGQRHRRPARVLHGGRHRHRRPVPATGRAHAGARHPQRQHVPGRRGPELHRAGGGGRQRRRRQPHGRHRVSRLLAGVPAGWRSAGDLEPQLACRLPVRRGQPGHRHRRSGRWHHDLLRSRRRPDHRRGRDVHGERGTGRHRRALRADDLTDAHRRHPRSRAQPARRHHACAAGLDLRGARGREPGDRATRRRCRRAQRHERRHARCPASSAWAPPAPWRPVRSRPRRR